MSDVPEDALRAIVIGEATRQARNRVVVAVRFGYALALCAVVAAMWVIGVEYGQSSPEELGRYLLGQYRDLQVLLAVVVGPAVVALGCEDRASLELLALTRQTPRRVLWGTVAARLAAVLAIALGGIPILAGLSELGGVSTGEVEAAAIEPLGLLLASSAVAAAIELSTGRVAGAVLGAMTWGLLVEDVVPALVPWDAVHLSAVAATVDVAPRALPLLVLLPVVAVVDGHGRDALTGRPDLRRPVASAVLALLGVGLLASYGRCPPSAGAAWLASADAALVAGGTGLLLDVLRLLLSPSPRERRARPVAGDPLAWRMLATRADGGPLAAPLTGLWAVAVLWAWWQDRVNPSRIDVLDPSLALLTVGVIATVASGVGAVAGERDQGTLDLLLATSRSSASLVLGWLVGVAVRSLPLLLLGAALRDVRMVAWIVPFWAFVAVVSLGAGRELATRAALGLLFPLALAFFVVVAQLELVEGGTPVRVLLAAPIVTEAPVGDAEVAGTAAAWALAAACAGCVVTVRLRRSGAR